jgi:hypothetical protein
LDLLSVREPPVIFAPRGFLGEPDEVRAGNVAEVKRADLTYEQLAKRLKQHGLSETADSVSAKLKRGTFPATFLLACLAALELEGLRLEDL